MTLAACLVETVFETGEKIADERMCDRLLPWIRLQIPLGHVGGVLATVGKDPVPGLVFRGTRASDLLIPRLRPRKDGVDVENDSAIREEAMVDDLADCEFCLGAQG